MIILQGDLRNVLHHHNVFHIDSKQTHFGNYYISILVFYITRWPCKCTTYAFQPRLLTYKVMEKKETFLDVPIRPFFRPYFFPVLIIFILSSSNEISGST